MNQDVNQTHITGPVNQTHLSARQDVAGQLDLGEVALADGLEQPVVPDVRLLVGAQRNGVPTSGTERPARPTGALL